MNIYEKMSAITSEVATVAKSLSIGTGKNAYKAVFEGDVLAAVKPIEEKYKIYSYPVERELLESAVITNTKEYNGQLSETKQQLFRIRTTYRFVNIENPEEYIDIVTYGDGVDPQDKAPGKAMTYADKYALLKAYKIQTGEDPDTEESGNLKSKTSDDMATEAQINLLKKFGREDQQAAVYLKEHVKSWRELTKKDASTLIEQLKK